MMVNSHTSLLIHLDSGSIALQSNDFTYKLIVTDTDLPHAISMLLQKHKETYKLIHSSAGHLLRNDHYTNNLRNDQQWQSLTVPGPEIEKMIPYCPSDKSCSAYSARQSV